MDPGDHRIIVTMGDPQLIVQALLVHGAHVNAKGKDGYPVLMYAAVHGDIEVIQINVLSLKEASRTKQVRSHLGG